MKCYSGSSFYKFDVVLLAEMYETHYWKSNDTFVLVYLFCNETNAQISLAVGPYKDCILNYVGGPSLNPNDTVLGLETFFPNGIPPRQERAGVGSQVMESIVMKEVNRNNSQMLYCTTEKDHMQNFLRKFDFQEVSIPFFSSSGFYKLLE